MPTELPIACSLPAADAAERLDWLEQLAKGSLIGTEQLGSVIELRFRAGEDVEPRLLAFIEAERKCCPFLDFELAPTPYSGIDPATGMFMPLRRVPSQPTCRSARALSRARDRSRAALPCHR